MTLFLLLALGASDPNFCDEQPTKMSPTSHGRPANGSVDGAVKLTESEAVRVLPKRHKERCLSWGTPRLVGALERAGREVQKSFSAGGAAGLKPIKASPALGVGNIGRPKGGSLSPYSHSHQAGRDCDLAFYQLDEAGPLAADDLEHFDASLKSPDGKLRFDVPRNWALVKALLTDTNIDVKWLFVSNELKAELLAHARKVKADSKLINRASEVLHQPSDAPPHDDHFHLRIRCTSAERDGDCID